MQKSPLLEATESAIIGRRHMSKIDKAIADAGLAGSDEYIIKLFKNAYSQGQQDALDWVLDEVVGEDEGMFTNPVFAVITNQDGYKYQTDIVENEMISNEIAKTSHTHGVDNYTSKVYDENVFDWYQVAAEQETNPDVLPDRHNYCRYRNTLRHQQRELIKEKV
jgi:hypothetical protein